jgi:alkyl sulfatase BDS1-like metallo-beta-lactamase superfamily hydrolase
VAYDKGEYRWVAELLDQAVLAKPDDTAAKELLARAYEQMGYQAESATWRNSYLTAAMELRNGPPAKGVKRSDLIELMKQTPTERFLEAMAASLDGPAADGKNWTFNLVLADTNESFVLWIENAVLHYRKGPTAANANATLTVTKDLFVQLLGGTAGLKETLTSDDLKVDGSKVDLVRFLGLLEKAPGNFAIVARAGN